jgi:hypothetical protein
MLIEARAFAFQGRCFVVARRGKQTRLADRLIRLPLNLWRPFEDGGQLPGIESWSSDQPPPQSAVFLRAGIDAANGPAWAAPTYTGPDHLSDVPTSRWCSDENKVRASKGDRQRTRPRYYIPLWHLACIAQKQRTGGDGEHHVTLP